MCIRDRIRKAKSEMELFGAIGALYALNYMDEGKSESAAAE